MKNILMKKVFTKRNFILVAAIYLFIIYIEWKTTISLKENKKQSIHTTDTKAYHLNSERIRRVEEVCRKVPHRPWPGMVKVNDETGCRSYECPVYVIKRHSFSFCFMHKIASTTFQKHFLQLHGFRNLTLQEIQYNGYRLTRYSIRAVMMDPFVRYYKVLFVRHPFARLVSSYYAKLVIECNPSRKSYPGPVCHIAEDIKLRYRTDRSKFDSPLTFKEFVRFLLDNHKKPFNSHWSRISNVCQPCNVHYDFIGKVENYIDDVHSLVNNLGVKKVIGNISIIMNKSHSERLIGECFSQITKAEFEQLYSIYRLDFEMFGYSKEPYSQYTL